jgi:hypothetical protein
MKNLGDEDEMKSATNLSKKSGNKVDKDWSYKVEAKITKMNTIIKTLTNKF